jgi:replicative DNA helicase
VARNVAENGIPVLYLDTELTSDIQLHRLSSLVSGVDLNHVETGQFKHNQQESEALWGCQKHIEGLSIDHFSVAGLAPHSIMSIARRWLSKTVGFTSSGAAKPCLIIYDYIKLMDDGGFKNNLQEYQLLGFLITALHNFTIKFNLPVLATVQLNRDGVEKEGAEVVSGSDRVSWLCSNFTILKKKIQTELNEDPPSNGIMKLVVTDTRFGSGMESGEYINVISQLEVGKFSEGKPFSLVAQSALENCANEEV